MSDQLSPGKKAKRILGRERKSQCLCCHHGNQERFLKLLKIELPFDSAVPLLGTHPKDFSILLQRHLHTIHKSQEIESASVSLDRWIGHENMIYTYNGIFFSYQEKMEYTVSRKMNKSSNYYLREMIQTQKDECMYCLMQILAFIVCLYGHVWVRA